MGLPYPGSPLVFLPLPFLYRAAHIPVERGGAGRFDSVRPRLLGALEIGPTSLKRGEGPPSVSSHVFESEWVAREGGGGGMSGG